MMQIWLLLSFLLPFAVFWAPHRMKGPGLRSFLFRRTLIVLPYLLWMGLLDLKKIQWNLAGVSLLIATVALLIWWERKEYLFKASAVYAGLAGRMNKENFFASLYNLSVFILAEEVFFRLAVLSVFPNKWAVVGQAVAFVAAHYATPWGKSLALKDLARQFVFALVAGSYFLATGDLIVCVLGHALLNMPEFIHLFRRFSMKPSEEEVLYGSF
ncbi:CPBP family intramembrane glutamic endopeptidase [Bdellovibrio sp.]|uniref:CPBP family intramembrane glutamic endopeptidase n=1 Tax=Bdellovibrio sp. TaxID=28201 RepID=UPI00322149DF